MKSLSNETKIMNLLIGLSIKNPNFTPILYNEGYQLEIIEPYFNNENGEVINPDLQLKSHNDKNLLFFEIKCGSIEDEQATKYKLLTREELINQNITSLDLSSSSFEFIYICENSSLEKIKKSEEINKYGFTILNVNNDVISNENDNIKGFSLRKIFQNPITIPTDTPTEFYPYSPEDGKDYIALNVFPSIMSLIAKGNTELNPEIILKESHIICYNHLSITAKNKLKAIIGTILSDLTKSDKEFLIKRTENGRFRMNSKNWTKFKVLFEKLIDKYKFQEKSIFEYEKKPDKNIVS